MESYHYFVLMFLFYPYLQYSHDLTRATSRRLARIARGYPELRLGFELIGSQFTRVVQSNLI